MGVTPLQCGLCGPFPPPRQLAADVTCLCKSKESTYSVIIKQGNEQRDYVTVKVIPFNCIAHPFFASFFGVISARTNGELDRFTMKAEQSREISGRFLQNELGESIS